MTEAELRALVRDAVARHLGSSASPSDLPRSPTMKWPSASGASHPSHFLYLTVVNTTDACVIEPDVRCNHCGYCKSHGH